MRPFGIVARSEEEARRLRDRFSGLLAEFGRVGTIGVGTGSTSISVPSGAVSSYEIGETGSWHAAGNDLDLQAALDQLAPRCDFVIVTGYPEAALPHVVVGGVEFDGEVVYRASEPEDVDEAAIRDAVAGIEPFETLESLVQRVKRSPAADRAGAIATFTGRVRAKDAPDDTPTAHLEFEKYAGVAEERMEALSDEFEAREGVHAVEMHHRTGVIEAGDDIVFVVVLAGHRREAFRTVEDGIDRLKEEVPIFKKEVTLDETFWVHERS